MNSIQPFDPSFFSPAPSSPRVATRHVPVRTATGIKMDAELRQLCVDCAKILIENETLLKHSSFASQAWPFFGKFDEIILDEADSLDRNNRFVRWILRGYYK